MKILKGFKFVNEDDDVFQVNECNDNDDWIQFCDETGKELMCFSKTDIPAFVAMVETFIKQGDE